MGSLVNFGRGPLRGLFYFEFSQEVLETRGAEMGSLEKIAVVRGASASHTLTCENAKTWSPSWRDSIYAVKSVAGPS